MVEPAYLDELTRKTRRLEFDDGLTDLQAALVFLLLGILNAAFLSEAGMEWYVRAVMANRELTIIALLGVFASIVLIAYGSRRLVRWLRAEKLSSHGGRFTPLDWQLDRWIALISVGAFLLIFISGLIIIPREDLDMHSGLRLTTAAAGAATAVIYLGMGRSLQVDRYRWVALSGLVGSLLVFFLPLSAAQSWVVFSLIWTLALSISGALTLRKALQRHGGTQDG